MSARGHKLMALLLSLTLLAGLTVPARAAGNVRLRWSQSGSSVELKLQGLEGESVYGVQLQMTVDGVYTAAFTPAADGAYSPECRVSSSDKRTRVTLYITSQKPLNSGDELPVGGLTLSGSFTMPSTATATLLGHELRPLAIADGTVVHASELTSSSGGGGGGYSGPTSYRIQVSHRHAGREL